MALVGRKTAVRITRRQAVGAICTGCAAVVGRRSWAFGTDAGGCWLAPPDGGADPTLAQLSFSTGNLQTDRLLGRALVRLATTFQVRPGFVFYDDARGMNALATPTTLVPNYVGTVLFGRRLYERTRSMDINGMTTIAVCAHEFGHIAQFSLGLREPLERRHPTVKLVELHADFMAGYFIADRKREFPELDIQGAGAMFDDLGDTDFGEKTHHGTSAERVGAIEAGYAFGRGRAADVTEAARAGAQFIISRYAATP
jgi:hypothetical protein